ncbi:BlaI/MecI/CopY family transcriptional regulator [Pseudenhygromyxa sp. WMMC2535]|uniref:BlaI/MecI/CopY family transcriptional regulator n=1 Tax=Pseudenhygromyxa sp. WMMC2535 TaxID=2712867 RepID=UPI0015583025|nr:BlaI/MecI/CopY family transcriptional regulator [Pseudenhygromyxa sp. WMMC2535]NVB38464.1 BlaI/MecI/CopY family transcriptional regulator [Pseudenhygromyxa sp. WMMC2535]
MEQLSDVQLAFMRALWARPGSSVGQVREFLIDEGRDLAPTTVSTQLSRLEKKGLIAHEVDGRQFLYRAQVSEAQVQRSVLARVTEGLFGGDVTALVHQLLDADEVGADELAEVKRLIEARERGQQ